MAKYFRGAKVTDHSKRFVLDRQVTVDSEPPATAIKGAAKGLALANRHKPWARRWLRENNVVIF